MALIVLFDTETTSLLAPRAASIEQQPYLIEFYGVKTDEGLDIVDELHCYVKPRIPIPSESTKIHGITDDKIADKPPFGIVWRTIANFFVGVNACVGHNLLYDKQVLSYELRRIGKETNFPWPPVAIDTLDIMLSTTGRRYALGDMLVELTGTVLQNAHSAKADTIAVLQALRVMKNRDMVVL